MKIIRTFLISGTTLLCFLFIISHYKIISSFSNTMRLTLLYPIIYISGLTNSFKEYYSEQQKSTQTLLDEYDLLQKKAAFFQEKYIVLQAHIWDKENTEQLIASSFESKSSKPCRIITRYFSAHEQYFLINQGSVDGITENMIAFANNCLVGRIGEVGPFHAKIFLVTDSRCTVPIMCGEKKVLATSQGQNTDQMILRYLSPREEIEENALAITSGTGLLFPYGLGVGIFCKNKDNSYCLTPLLDLKTIRYCAIIQKEINHKPVIFSS